jgi:hypothetical protein
MGILDSGLLNNKPIVRCNRIESTSITLYDVLYSINEDFYINLLSATKQSFSESGKPAMRSALEWLIPASMRFLNYISKNSKLLDIEMRSIQRAIKRDKTHTYEHRVYYIRNIKYKVPLPPDMYNFLPSLQDINKYNGKDLTTLFAIPTWFTKYRTPETMSKYLEDNTKISIPEGSYQIKEILPHILKYAKESSVYFTKLRDKVIEEKNRLDKIKNKNASDVRGKCIEFMYMQLSVYHRSAMTVYGKSITELGNLIHSMFEDIDSESIKLHSFDNHFELIKKFNKELV